MIGDKRAKLTIFLVLYSLLVSLQNIAAVRAAEDSWTILTPMPTPRERLEVAVVNGKIYAIGGVNWTTKLSTNEMYDPETDTWTTKTPMPTARTWFAIAVYQNRIYCIGGSTNQSEYSGINEVYDPMTDTWETRTPMPTPRKYIEANVVDNKIYLISGDSKESFYSSVNEVYDPISDTWTTKEPIPVAVIGYSSAVLDDKIYIISGSAKTLNQIYCPQNNTWINGTNIPLQQTYGAAGATSGDFAPKRIYVLGGGNPMFPSGFNHIYDPEKDEWSVGESMPTSRRSFGVGVVNDILYVIGGSTGWEGPHTAANEQYTPVGYIPEFPSWIILPLFLMATFSAIILKKRLFHQRS